MYACYAPFSDFKLYKFVRLSLAILNSAFMFIATNLANYRPKMERTIISDFSFPKNWYKLFNEFPHSSSLLLFWSAFYQLNTLKKKKGIDIMIFMMLFILAAANSAVV